MLLPPDASPEDMEALPRAAAWLAEGLALVTSTPSGLVPDPPPAAAPRPRSHPCQP